MPTGLLIIDIQNDFCPPNGSLAVSNGDKIIQSINDLKQRGNFDLVVYTKDWHPSNHISFASNHVNEQPFTLKNVPAAEHSNELVSQMLWPVHCVQNSSGSEFHPDLSPPLDSDIIVYKGTNPYVDSYSGFFDNQKKVQTRLDSVLKSRNIDRVVVVGLALDYCVGYTALDAVELGYQTIVPLYLCASVAAESQKQMLEKLKAAGVSLAENSDALNKLLL
jgi:nicotinamidase/pyrazinamidase